MMNLCYVLWRIKVVPRDLFFSIYVPYLFCVYVVMSTQYVIGDILDNFKLQKRKKREEEKGL